MSSEYGRTFYEQRHQRTLYAANTLLSLVQQALPPVTSAVDFGCGVGTWLSVLREHGVQTVQGLDGAWVEQDLLQIPSDSFRQVDFEQPIALSRRYDLAISLEVAEHISEAAATQFVVSITRAADFVLFSAAIPHQGGIGHINLQWPGYWVELFAQQGYVPRDILRRQIWDDPKVQPWYRQNALIFVREQRQQEVRLPPGSQEPIDSVPAMVHPDMYGRIIGNIIDDMSTLEGSWQLFSRALKHRLLRMFKRAD